MYNIPPRNLQRHKPLIIHKLARKAWGTSDKGLLSRALFKEIIEDLREYVSDRIKHLSKEELTALLADYLRISGYTVTEIDESEGLRYITSSLVTSDGMQLHGCAFAANRWSANSFTSLQRAFPTADFYHVLVLEDAPEEVADRVRLITATDVLQMLIFIVVFDYFFDEYTHSILTMPGFKEFMHTYLAEETSLTTERVQAFETGWERLKQ